jgi:hypothetical protein
VSVSPLQPFFGSRLRVPEGKILAKIFFIVVEHNIAQRRPVQSICKQQSFCVFFIDLNINQYKMGAGASVHQDEVKHLPQYTILGGDDKFHELKGEGTVPQL